MHRTLIESFCGWCRFSAIFSGRTCTIQNNATPATGTAKMMNQARPLANESSASPARKEARARAGASSAAHRGRHRRFMEDRVGWGYCAAQHAVLGRQPVLPFGPTHAPAL